MGSEVNPVCLSQVSLFVLILEGSGQVVRTKLMTLSGRKELKWEPHFMELFMYSIPALSPQLTNIPAQGETTFGCQSQL